MSTKHQHSHWPPTNHFPLSLRKHQGANWTKCLFYPTRMRMMKCFRYSNSKLHGMKSFENREKEEITSYGNKMRYMSYPQSSLPLELSQRSFHWFQRWAYITIILFIYKKIKSYSSTYTKPYRTFQTKEKRDSNLDHFYLNYIRKMKKNDNSHLYSAFRI